MRRFLMLVGVAVVAGVMYVAAAPGSRQATGPTAKQFAALKKQVAKLQKQVKAVDKEAIAGLGVSLYRLQSNHRNSPVFATSPV